MTHTNHDEPLTWVTVNLEYGGIDRTPAAPLLHRFGTDDLTRLNTLPEVVTFANPAPTLIFVQEGLQYDLNGEEMMHYVERLLRRAGVGVYRGLLTRSLHNDLHQVVFINTARVDVGNHWRGEDPNEGARRYGFVRIIVDGDEDRSIVVKSDHWNAKDGDERLEHAKFIAPVARGAQRAILAGDVNSITSRRSRRQGEPQRRFLAQAPSDRFDKGYWPHRPRWWWSPWRRRRGDTTADTRALDFLIDMGWVDQHIADNNTTPTIHPRVDRGGELIIDRALTHGGLATVPGSVQVDTTARGTSDHRAVAGALMITSDPPPKTRRRVRDGIGTLFAYTHRRGHRADR